MAYGLALTLDELDRAFQPPRDQSQPKTMFVSKEWLVVALRRYSRVSPLFDRIPMHAWIEIDVHGVYATSQRAFTWWTLESTLFEDLANLWNDALAAHTTESPTHPSDRDVKRAAALLRATARQVFHLVEGYLNGVASDALLCWGSRLTADDRTRLTEFDDAKQRPRYLTLRDKILIYPKLAVRAQHAPIQPTSTPEFERLLEAEKKVRNYLVHPRPIERGQRGVATTMNVFFSLDLKEVGALIDDAISLIRQIDGIAYEGEGSVDLWIHDRRTDGRFGDEVFR